MSISHAMPVQAVEDLSGSERLFMTKREIALEYLNRFCRGDIDGVKVMLTTDFRLRGPLFEFDSRDEYIESLQESPILPTGHEILDITEGSSSVSIFYAYQKSSGTVIIAQLFKFKNDKIAETLIVFDSAVLG